MSTASAEGLRALCGSLVAITTIVSGLRLHARRVQRVEFGIDDWIIIPSYMAFIGMVACALLGVQLRQFGYPQTQVAASHLPFRVEASLVVSLDILSAASLGFTRISALLFYCRVFCVLGRTRVLRAAIYTSIMVISLWMAAFIILPPLQCGPDLSVWSAPTSVRAAHCSMGNKIILGFCISDLLIETAVIVMPIPSILRLQTSLKRRLALLFVFLTAFVSLGAVVARLVITVKLHAHQIKDLSEANTTETFMWILEAGFALIAVNLPSLWWFRHKIQPEKILVSVRSFISLRSMRSSSSGIELNGSQALQTGGANGKRARDRYDISQTGNSQWEKLPESPRTGTGPSGSAGKKNWAVSDHNTEWSTRFTMPGNAVELGRKISESRQV